MKKKKGQQGWFALKLDLEKAYDRLEWPFIIFCLRSKGFDEDSCSLIHSCFSSTSISVKVNGSISDSFQPSRGIRQGDPISPYLFIICMDHLSQMIQDEVSKKAWHPFQFPRTNLSISHLLFADDLLLFGKTDQKTLNSLHDTLHLFFNLSGQTMNNSKSELLFSPNTHPFVSKKSILLQIGYPRILLPWNLSWFPSHCQETKFQSITEHNQPSLLQTCFLETTTPF